MIILFIGDVVGQVGRRMVKTYLPKIIEKYHVNLVIANGENATHGSGLIKTHYDFLLQCGVNIITLGNHYNGKNEINRYIDKADFLIRPLNLKNNFKGTGSALFKIKDVYVRVSNLLGTAFMKEEVNNPYKSILKIIENDKANIHIVDYHAEATGEKICLGYLLDGKISALIGTHTHVQTVDAKILPHGTGYISDVGMTGFKDGSLGVNVSDMAKRIFLDEKTSINIPLNGNGIFSGVVLDIDETTSKTKKIFRLYIEEGAK